VPLLAAFGLAGCAGEVRGGVDVTLLFDASVADTSMAAIARLAFTAQGDESGVFSLAIDRPLLRSERVIYRPAGSTQQISLAIAALANDETVLAVGETGTLAVSQKAEVAITVTMRDDRMPSGDDLGTDGESAPPDLPPPDGAFYTCTNAFQDGDETGVDCGGSCLACAGTSCVQNGDCASGVCDGVCVPASSPPFWLSGPSLGGARAYLGAAAKADGRLVVAGGTTNGSPSGAVGTVELLTRSGFVTGPSLLTPRYTHGVGVDDGGVIYVAGGWNVSGTLLTSAESLGTAASSWVAIAAMPGGHAYHALARLDPGRVLLADTTPCVAYDVGSGTWIARGSPATLRDRCGLVHTGDNKVWNIGGNGSGAVANVDAYDATGDSWLARAPLSIKRYGLGGAVGGDLRIYAVGGIDGIALKAVEAYLPGANRWSSKVAQLGAARWAHAVGVGPDGRIYAIGGLDDKAAPTATSEVYGPVVVASLSSGTVTLTLSNFAASANGRVLFDSAAVASFSTSATGTAMVSFAVPAATTSGAHLITARDARSDFPVTALVNVP
jgi:hypothetical protein